VNIVIFAAVLLSAFILMRPKLAQNKGWKATITPLASIIGSGFLVLGPILSASYGKYAPLVMAGLCLSAYLFGSAIRFNIHQIDIAADKRASFALKIETLSAWVLAFAYIISVAYYLNLFGAFAVSLTNFDDQYHAKLLTTAMLLLILMVGWTRGYGALERLEQVSVSIKLAIIAGLLVGLALFFTQQAAQGALFLNPAAQTGWAGVTLAFGLIVTVQGFETSRYLGDEYGAQTRIKSMARAQWVSTAIYIIYIMFLTYIFKPSALKLDETAIIGMMAMVAPILPLLLVIAALSAQFSAAIADTSGAGGLFSEVSKGRLKPKESYVLLVIIGIILTWSANIFEIISYASKSFAFYYSLQAVIAALGAMRVGQHMRAIIYGLLAILGALIVIFGVPVEGNAKLN
jgi:hypothetical protein